MSRRKRVEMSDAQFFFLFGIDFGAFVASTGRTIGITYYFRKFENVMNCSLHESGGHFCLRLCVLYYNLSVLFAVVFSFYFQNVIGPIAQESWELLLISMK